MRVAALLIIVAQSFSAWAQTYTVEPGDAPVDLSEELSAAAAAWNQAAEEADLEEAAGAPNVFSFVDPELLGPDVVSATIVRDGEEGLGIWLNPAIIEEFPQALLHEFGLILGLPAAAVGVMEPALSVDTPESPTEADLEALVAALGRTGGDIDGDGDVDIYDLAALGRLYGREGVNLVADVDRDGDVDAEDVALLRENYTFTEPRPVDGPEALEDEDALEDPDTVENEDALEDPDALEDEDAPEDADAL